MSILLKYKVTLSDNGESVNVKDNTGQYSILNTGGWGAPNVLVGSALTAAIKISKRNTDGTFGAETQVDVYPTLPSDAGVSVDIAATDAGQGDSFPDGVYRFVYAVTGTEAAVPFNYTITQYKSFHSSINCCYQKLAVKVANCSCNCQDLDDKFKEMTIQLAILCRAEGKGDLNAVQKEIDFITKMCTKCGCGCA